MCVIELRQIEPSEGLGVHAGCVAGCEMHEAYEGCETHEGFETYEKCRNAISMGYRT